MSQAEIIKTELKKYINKEKAEFLPRFFKCGPGEYGEGDKFLGIVVPDQRKVVKAFYKKCNLNDIQTLLYEKFHEYRLTGFLLLVEKYERSKDPTEKDELCNFYLKHLKQANNWDLVDLSSYKILGSHLLNENKEILYKLAKSKNLWEQRVSMIATYHFIKNKHYEDTLKIAKILLNHKHDLIHKAVGWMLREIGKKDIHTEKTFLNKYYKTMPRTMLRYAIEKFETEERLKYLKGEI